MQGPSSGIRTLLFKRCRPSLLQMVKIVQADPAIDTVTASTGGQRGGGSTINQGRVNIQLKALEGQKSIGHAVIDRLRPAASPVRRRTLYLQASQDVRVGRRQSAALFSNHEGG